MSDFIDEFTIHKFLTLLHSRAAVALSHVRRPGVLQLVSIAPDDRGMTVSPFAIGDIDSMFKAAVLTREPAATFMSRRDRFGQDGRQSAAAASWNPPLAASRW